MNLVSLGDLLSACAQLRIVDHDTREAVCLLLLAEAAVIPQEPAPPPSAPPPFFVNEPDLAYLPDWRLLPAETRHGPRHAPTGSDTSPRPAELDFSLSETDAVSPAAASKTLLVEVDSGELLKSGSGHVAAPEPLLERSWERRVLGALLATDAALGSLDERALIRQLLRGRPVRNLPRRLRPTMRRGAQVLFDRHLSNMVFFSDQSSLRSVIEGIVGRERVTFLRCVGFPPQARIEPLPALEFGVSALGSLHWQEYPLPPPQTPVLIVSDFGLVRGVHALPRGHEKFERWIKFTDALRNNRNPIYALVPCEARRYPDTVRERVRVLAWDRNTHPSDARQARRCRSWRR